MVSADKALTVVMAAARGPLCAIADAVKTKLVNAVSKAKCLIIDRFRQMCFENSDRGADALDASVIRSVERAREETPGSPWWIDRGPQAFVQFPKGALKKRSLPNPCGCYEAAPTERTPIRNEPRLCRTLSLVADTLAA